jgi:CheY-like chemotaxis protein
VALIFWHGRVLLCWLIQMFHATLTCESPTACSCAALRGERDGVHLACGFLRALVNLGPSGPCLIYELDALASVRRHQKISTAMLYSPETTMRSYFDAHRGNLAGHRRRRRADHISPHALELVQSRSDFPWVVSDFAMPNMTGAELFLQRRASRPDLPFVIATGYNETPV